MIGISSEFNARFAYCNGVRGTASRSSRTVCTFSYTSGSSSSRASNARHMRFRSVSDSYSPGFATVASSPSPPS